MLILNHLGRLRHQPHVQVCTIPHDVWAAALRLVRMFFICIALFYRSACVQESSGGRFGR